MPKVRIISENGIPWQTQITDSETGERIPGVFAFEVEQAVNRPDVAEYSRVTLHAWVGALDVVGDATIVTHCPHCHAELPTPSQETAS